MNGIPRTIEAMSTRLFPKNQGANRYAISGIASRCDWVVLSDAEPPQVHLARRIEAGSPRHVFLSLRFPFAALAFFFDEILPRIDSPFVLVSGSEDVTVPHQLDLRWRRFTAGERGRIEAFLQDDRLIHWYVENLDEQSHPKLSPLPVGMVFTDPGQSHDIRIPNVPAVSERPLRVLCAHRVREGPQWDTRRRVTNLCRQHWADFCTVLDEEVPEDEFFAQVQRHAFVVCVEGGGLDPSPKAWHALLHGAIPIVRSTALDAAYGQLPIALVESWEAAALAPQKLQAWAAKFAVRLDSAKGRSAVVRRLGLEYWWSQITTGYGLAANPD